MKAGDLLTELQKCNPDFDVLVYALDLSGSRTYFVDGILANTTEPCVIFNASVRGAE